MKGPVEIPIDGTLDLHTFHPREVPSLVKEYVKLCREKGIYEIRLIHGKGKGILRRTVHRILDNHSLVAGYHDARDGSGWGATIAYLHKP